MNDRIHHAIRALKDVVESGTGIALGFSPESAADLLAALPADLVAAATVEMPKEPGLYVGPGGTRGPVWRVEGLRTDGGTPTTYREGGSDIAGPEDGPFRRLVAEGDGPTHVFTGPEIRAAWDATGSSSGVAPFEFAATFVNTYAEEAGR